jgi:hypothetical protein
MLKSVPRMNYPGFSIPGFVPRRHPGASALGRAAHRKGLIQRHYYLGSGKLVEALAEAVEAALAALELARQAG